MKRLITPLSSIAWFFLKRQIRRQFPTVQQLNTKTLAHWLETGKPKIQ